PTPADPRPSHGWTRGVMADGVEAGLVMRSVAAAASPTPPIAKPTTDKAPLVLAEPSRSSSWGCFDSGQAPEGPVQRSSISFTLLLRIPAKSPPAPIPTRPTPPAT